MAILATMNEPSRHPWHQEAHTTRRILLRLVARLTTEVKAPPATRRTTTLQRHIPRIISLTCHKITWAMHRLHLLGRLQLRTWGRKGLDLLLGLLPGPVPTSLPIM